MLRFVRMSLCRAEVLQNGRVEASANEPTTAAMRPPEPSVHTNGAGVRKAFIC